MPLVVFGALVIVLVACVPPGDDKSPTPSAGSSSRVPVPSAATATATPTAAAATETPLADLKWTRLAFSDASDAGRPTVGTQLRDKFVLGGFTVDTGPDVGLGWSGSIWTSDDAIHWQELDLDLGGTPIWSLSAIGSQVIGSGPVGFCFMHCDSGLLADEGSAIFTASTTGDWQRTIRPSGLEHGLVRQIAETEGGLVGIGSVNNPDRPSDPGPYPDGTESLAMAWSAQEPLSWTPAEGLPKGYAITDLHEIGGTFVALLDAGFEVPARLVVSRDGNTWEPGFGALGLETLVASDEAFLALGSELDQAVAYRSTDGIKWTKVNLEPQLIVARGEIQWMGDQFLTIAEPASEWGDGIFDYAAWTSADGLIWQKHDLPEDFPENGYPYIIAFDSSALVTTSGPEAYGVWLVEPVVADGV